MNSYFYSASSGKTTVYVVDTGIDISHIEFNGRASWDTNFVTNIDEDDNGHGTHLAGMIGGSSVGVTRDADLVAVKILDSKREGSVEHFVQAIDWVINNSKKRSGNFIINYSAVGEISSVRADAIDKAHNAVILVVNAAGNSNRDACQHGPANMSRTLSGFIVVAALNYTNTPATSSNTGYCIDVWVPGVDIKSSLPGSYNYGYMDRTSNAAVFVSGIAAYLRAQNTYLSLSDLYNEFNNANPNEVLNNVPGNTGSIIYNHFFG